MTVVRPVPKRISRRGVIVICKERTTQRLDVCRVALQTRDLLSLGTHVQSFSFSVSMSMGMGMGMGFLSSSKSSIPRSQERCRTERRGRTAIVHVDVPIIIVVVCVWWRHEVAKEASRASC